MAHRVDLTAFNGLGWCSCEAYEFRIMPLLNAGIAVPHNQHCCHVRQARAYFAIEIVQRLLSHKILQDTAKQ